MVRDAAGARAAQRRRTGLGVVLGAVSAGVAAWAVTDYRRWRALGVGGLPPTPAGWLTTTRLRLRGGDRFRVATQAEPGEGVLARLPTRRGARPRVAPHPIPHRVLGEDPAAALRERLAEAVDERVRGDDALEYRTSRWEKNNQAVFTRPGDGSPGVEVGHLHPHDASVHVTLHPADAQRVVDLGWGELHPLAGRQGLPVTYTLLYPPRTTDEVDVVGAILDAAVAYGRGA